MRGRETGLLIKALGIKSFFVGRNLQINPASVCRQLKKPVNQLPANPLIPAGGRYIQLLNFADPPYMMQQELGMATDVTDDFLICLGNQVMVVRMVQVGLKNGIEFFAVECFLF